MLASRPLTIALWPVLPLRANKPAFLLRGADCVTIQWDASCSSCPPQRPSRQIACVAAKWLKYRKCQLQQLFFSFSIRLLLDIRPPPFGLFFLAQYSVLWPQSCALLLFSLHRCIPSAS
ncbi:hypothetical protein BDV18DRAFT_132861 [Aspergillus unguis]